MTPDVVNAVFELVGSLFSLLNCRVLLRDRDVKGVSLWAMGFFTVWGYWNLYFYPFLGQTWSFRGALALTMVNTIWFCMYFYVARPWRYKPPNYTSLLSGELPKHRL